MKTITNAIKKMKLFFIFPMIFAGSSLANAACQANFTYSVNGQTVTFTNTSTGTNSNTNYMWNFGDNNYGYNMNEVHTYQFGGYYTVCLTIYDSMQTCYSIFCDSLYINGPQSCIGGFTYVVNGNTVTFTNTSTPYSTTTMYYWQFGQSNSGSTVGTSQGISFTFPNAGTYNVCLAFYDPNSQCGDTVCQYVTVGSQTSCNASFTYVVNGNTVTFTNTSSSGQAGWYQWSFGDNSPYNYTFNPVHTYPGPGTYNVCVILTDSFCVDTFCQNVTIGGNGFNEYSQINAFYFAYPNPFSGSTTISYTLFENSILELSIYDLAGRKIAVLESGNKNAGQYEITWSAAELNAGSYFLSFEVNGSRTASKLTLIK